MRILHVSPTYPPAYYGGAIASAHAVNKYLVRAGAEVVVYTTAVNGGADLDVPLGTPLDVEGVQVTYFKPDSPRACFYSGGLRRALSAAAPGFDALHETSVFLSTSWLTARAAARNRKPYLISPRGALMRAPLRSKQLKKALYIAAIEKRNLRNATAIHFTAAIEKEEYDTLGLPRQGSVLIPNGLDTETLAPGDGTAFRKRFGIRPEQKVVLFLGRISWKKGLDTLLESFGGLARELPDAVLVIAGGDDEGYMPTVQKLIAGQDISSRVVMTGTLQGEDRSNAYAAADVFILASYAENFGNSVAEAMHFGVPVVITDAVGLAPQVRAAEAGFVTRKDPLEVKFALFKLLQSPALRRAMGEHGRRLVKEDLSYTAVAGRFLEAYTQCIAAYRTGRTRAIDL
jgi:glycosyltransferase involved in cell wall biosynthesis